MRKLVVLDGTYLCHKMLYALPSFAGVDGELTHIIYGFLRQITSISKTFHQGSIVFCWDAPKKTLYRKALYPEYKNNRQRKMENEEHREALFDLYRQMNLLRNEILPEMGFRNNIRQDRLEADDLIAEICNQEDKLVTIIADDNDLFQCLNERVLLVGHADKRNTKSTFEEKYGIHPPQWADVKAYAGCDTDCVKGIEGIGEKRALKYVQGVLGRCAARDKIDSEEGQAIYRRNIRLVKLPFKKTQPINFTDDELSWPAIKRVLNKYKMNKIMSTNVLDWKKICVERQYRTNGE